VGAAWQNRRRLPARYSCLVCTSSGELLARLRWNLYEVPGGTSVLEGGNGAIYRLPL